MIRIVQAFIAGSIAALACSSALAQNAGPTDPLTVDQIIERYVAARGGAEAWRKTQTMAWTGHVESGPGGRANTPFLMLFKRPDATRFEVIAQGHHTVRAFDGVAGWKLQPTDAGVPETKPYNAEELSYAHDAGGLDGPLFDYRAKGVRIELQAPDHIAGHDAYRLKLTLPSGKTRTDWIDAQSFLELKYDREARNLPGRPGTVSVYYSDYQSVLGLVMPFTIETGVGTNPSKDKMIIEKIAINPPLDDGVFSEPTASIKRHGGVVIDTTRSPVR
jgi:hypothetical protein